jgi:hypothetical protein
VPFSYRLRLHSLTCFAIFFAAAVTASATPTCVTGSLASYVSLDQAGGCQVGDQTFFRFSFGTATGNVSLASASDILVTPFASGGQVGLSFSSSYFQLNNPEGQENANYLIGYSVDPPPIIIGQRNRLDPPQGNVQVTQNVCTNDVFANSCEFGVPYSSTVTPTNPESFVYFGSPVPFIDVETQIQLEATAGHPAGFDALESGTLLEGVPEPGTMFLMAAGFALTLFSVLRRQANSH